MKQMFLAGGVISLINSLLSSSVLNDDRLALSWAVTTCFTIAAYLKMSSCKS
jgi:hypothetical protein